MAQSEPTHSAVVPASVVKSRKSLGLSAIIAVLTCLANSRWALVTPRWEIWVVGGVVVLLWGLHVVIVDHALVHGSGSAASLQAANKPIDSLLHTFEGFVPAILDKVLASHAGSANTPSGEAAAAVGTTTTAAETAGSKP